MKKKIILPLIICLVTFFACEKSSNNAMKSIENNKNVEKLLIIDESVNACNNVIGTIHNTLLNEFITEVLKGNIDPTYNNIRAFVIEAGSSQLETSKEQVEITLNHIGYEVDGYVEQVVCENSAYQSIEPFVNAVITEINEATTLSQLQQSVADVLSDVHHEFGDNSIQYEVMCQSTSVAIYSWEYWHNESNSAKWGLASSGYAIGSSPEDNIPGVTSDEANGIVEADLRGALVGAFSGTCTGGPVIGLFAACMGATLSSTLEGWDVYWSNH